MTVMVNTQPIEVTSVMKVAITIMCLVGNDISIFGECGGKAHFCGFSSFCY